ncbi:hypothetical protein GZH47_28100 [Paenibacillus rhizovicinus]|uniref:Uncharacterized protein n=1 Tax=Paenibacillus rhizovicinus TaxID=2704463 RepID=A0A6C0P6X9_9BACL|nr:hypothetical protein [Paenibacillus rhizovicinus]QHW34278.1 hypothetical protein GZH47_28100 [Paenibacillus rhizovicinus]
MSKSEAKATEAAFERIVHSMNSSLRDVEGSLAGMRQLIVSIDEIGEVTDKVVISADQLQQAARFA